MATNLDADARSSRDAWSQNITSLLAFATTVAVVVFAVSLGVQPEGGVEAPGAEGSPQASAELSISATPTEQPAATSSPGATLQGSRLVLATSAPDSPGMDALAIGNLAGEIRGGTVCFWLEPTSGSVDGPRTALLWPFGFGALADPLRLTGPDAQVIAAVGDAVGLGGGGMREGYMPTATRTRAASGGCSP